MSTFGDKMNYLKRYTFLFIAVFLMIVVGLIATYIQRTIHVDSELQSNQSTITKNIEITDEWDVAAAPVVEIDITSKSKKKYENLDTNKLVLDIPVLMYHHIDTIPQGFENDAIAVGLRVSPLAFEAQMNSLKENGYTTLHIDDYEQIAMGLKPAPQKPILITIDDGYTDNYTQALPILKKNELIGNFAIVTKVLGTGEYMSLEQLKEISDSGMGIMNHTTLHCSLAERVIENGERKYLPNSTNTALEPCPNFVFGGTLSLGQVQYELTEAKKFLDEQLGIDVRTVVYPFGNYNSQTLEIVEKTGHNFGLTTKYSVTPFSPETTLLELPRITVGGQQTTELRGFFAGL